MNWIIQRHRKFWSKEHLSSFLLTLILLAVALIVQKVADTYVGNLTGPAVGDLFLDHLPAVDIDFMVVQGALFLTFIAILIGILKPKYILFGLKSLSVFIIVRSFFISLTHLGIDPHQLKLDTDSFDFGLYNFLYNTKGDFFFSGHTGLPFLMALMMWNEKPWRYFFIGMSFILGVSVLLAHIHYSIDVFAAPFMTYGIYSFCEWVFKKDLKLINGRG